ncbi:MAG: hypothetical protein M1830_010292 [Pleopsidium flavum]|nr:MAG: hypothetical protein M1830_010292 [Pleopsidium flavum]
MYFILYGLLTHYQGKRLFIKDITHYLVPPNGKPASIAPSLLTTKKGVGTEGSSVLTTAASPSSDATAVETNGSAKEVNGTATKPPYPYATAAEPGNPTVIPTEILKQFHFTFLIRHPRSSIPSYYRCTIPPLDEVTGFYDFMPSEAGYDEVRRVFDYLRSIGHIGPDMAGQANTNSNGDTNDAELERDHEHQPDKHNGTPNTATNGTTNPTPSNIEICVIDADDLLANPAGIISAYCQTTGLTYDASMLKWDTPTDHAHAKAAFEKWKGFHEDAIESCELKARTHKNKKHPPSSPSSTHSTTEAEMSEWKAKFGNEGARIIAESVERNLEDYLYLKGFALQG